MRKASERAIGLTLVYERNNYVKSCNDIPTILDAGCSASAAEDVSPG